MKNKTTKQKTLVLAIAVVTLIALIITFKSMKVRASSYSDYYEKGSYGTVSGGNLRVRPDPSTKGKQIGLIKNGTKVYIEGPVTYTSDENVWAYAPDYGGYIAINWLKDIYSEIKEDLPEITCSAFTDHVWRTGESMSLLEIAPTIKVSNYSSEYSLSISNVDIASTFDFYPSIFGFTFKARAVGVASITITATDNNGKLSPVSKTFKVTVFPSTMEEAMDVIVERLNGKFLTVNQKSCTGKNHKSCENCEMHHVLSSRWIKDLFPEITFSDQNFQQTPGKGYSCWGGSQIITYIAAELLNGGNAKLDYNRVPRKDSVFKFNKTDVSKYAKVGDHLRLNDSHSIVLLKINSDNTVKCIDVNSHQDGTNCRVAVYNRKLNGTKMKIYRTSVK